MINNYKGYEILKLSEKEMADFYQAKDSESDLTLLENEFLLLANKQGKIIDNFIKQDKIIRSTTYDTIQNN